MFTRLVRASAAAPAGNCRFSAAVPQSASEGRRRNALSQSAAESYRNNDDSVKDTLGKRLLTLVYTKRTVDMVFKKWKLEGRSIRSFEINKAVRDLRKLKRFKHAIEVCEWRAKQKDIPLNAGNYALHLDLVAKLHGIKRAEKFFKDIPAQMVDHSTYSVLLHSYVQNNLSEKAEALMAKISESGLIANPLPYNHMISLYMANGQLEKVPAMIQELKRNISPNVITYNMWLTLCMRQNDVKAAEEVYSELVEAKLDPDWITYSTLANVYTKNGLTKKATNTLKEMEKLASKKNRTIYSSLLSLRTNIGDKVGVQGVWRKMKMLFKKRNDSEYTSMISSLLKFDELKEAEKLYTEWESVTGTKDSRVGNLLIAAYINGGKMELAKNFYERMSKNGIKASYTTYELFTYGYLKEKDVEQSIYCFKAAVKSVAKWKSSNDLVSKVFSVVEEEGNVEGAEKLLDFLRSVNVRYVTTEIYNSVLRTYAKAGKIPPSVAERMSKDKVQMDDETRELIKITSVECFSSNPELSA